MTMTQALVTAAQQVASLTISEIRKYICPNATEPEALMFLRLCQAQGLNPFLREAYLIKYNQNSAATMVVGKDAFTRRAEDHPQFAGFKAGIIIIHSGEIVEREGAFSTPDETLAGGWAEVFRHDRTVPFRSTVRLEEYNSKQGQWNKMPATMIRKVALVQALREAFPTAFRGLYDAAEMGVDPETLPTNVIDVQAESPRRGPASTRGAVVDSTATATEVPAVTAESVVNVTRAESDEIKLLVGVLGWTPDDVTTKLRDLYSAERLRDLPRDQVQDFLDYLRTQAARQQQREQREQREQRDAEDSGRATAGTA